MFGLLRPKDIHAMIGNRDSLSAIIGRLPTTTKYRRRILQHLIPLFLMMPRKINFKQMAYYSPHNETTLHRQFAINLELRQFNMDMVKAHGSGRYFIIFDPSFLPKSGKKTPDLDWFWSGCAGSIKRGLEIGGFAVGDLDNHTAFHLEAIRTPGSATLKTAGLSRNEHYQQLFKERKAVFEQFSRYIVADGYFGTRPFVDTVCSLGLHLLSCLRTNVCLHYRYDGPKKSGKGRNRIKGEKIDLTKPDAKRLPIIFEDADVRLRSAVVYVKSLRRLVQLVLAEFLREDGSLLTRKLYFSTDMEQQGLEVMQYYKCRFQIEFLYRDAKQFAGLAHCQSTDPQKITNHINLSLTSISLAKAAHWLPIPKENREAFSMADIKMYYHNQFLLERFSVALGLNPTETKNNPKIIELLYSTAYAA